MDNTIPVYDEKGLFPPTLAVDFDGTLVTNKFPEIGEFNPEVLAAVKAYKASGWKIILWTCRTDTMLSDAVKACEAEGLTFDAVNDNLPEVQEYFGGNTRKVFANLYWDDRSAILVQSDTTQPGLLCTMPLTMNGVSVTDMGESTEGDGIPLEELSAKDSDLTLEELINADEGTAGDGV